jgi:hypothetical protein
VKLKAAAPQKAAAPAKMSAAATKKSANAVAAKAKEYYEAVGCDFGAVDWSRLVGAGALIGRDAALAAATKPVVRPNGISGSLLGTSGSFRDGGLRGSASANLGYWEANFRFQSNKSGGYVAGLYSKISAANASGQIGIGNETLSAGIKAVGDLGTATANAGIEINPLGIGASIGAKASVASGRATGVINVFGWELELGVTGDFAALGATLKIGSIADNNGSAYVIEPSFAVGLGVGLIIRIRPPQVTQEVIAQK